jgi:hypothetical protein
VHWSAPLQKRTIWAIKKSKKFEKDIQPKIKQFDAAATN